MKCRQTLWCGRYGAAVRYVQQYTDDNLVAELQRVAVLVEGKLTKAAFEERSTVTSVTVLRRFGTWREALDLAGLSDRSAHRDGSERLRRRRVIYTDEELIAEMQAVAKRVGSDVITQDDLRYRSELFGATVLKTRFGSFPAACEAAGLRTSNMANRWTDEELAANVREVAEAVGHAPMLADMNRPPSRITSRTYTYRFGTWAAAVEALARS